QEAGILPGQTNKAFDVSSVINNSTWWFQIIRGVFNIDTIMTWFQVVAYVLYLSITLTVFLVTGRTKTPAANPAASSADGAKATDAAATGAAVPAAGAVAAGAVLATSAADGSSTGTVSASAASTSGGDVGGPSDATSEPPTTPGASGADGGGDQPPTTDGPTPARGAPEPMSTGKKWSIGGAIVAVPVVLAVVFVMLVGGSGGSTTQSIQVTQDACVPSWNAPPAGQSTFNIKNASTSATDIELVTHPGGLIVAEIEVLGPSTSRDLPVNLAEGEYQWRCVTGGEQATYSSVQTTSGGAAGQGSYAFAPVTIEEITPYLEQYRVYVGAQLKILDGQVVALKDAVDSGNREAAKNAWLPGQLTYHRIGAAYGAFGEDGDAVNGLAQSLPEGVNDPDFVGFHKIEYQLWSGAPMAQIRPQAADLVDAVRNLEKQLPKFTFDALEVVTRAHEILEDTQRFVVTGQDDYGSGTSYAHAVADTEGTRTLIGILAPMLETRQPTLVPTANPELDQLQAALNATKRNGQWVPVSQMDLATRMPTNAALGQVLETIAPIPDILEIQA
ncbi:MAG: EfeM/EfeO family lipoprotein, partial [Candidatus Nanopelagicales bacterium]